MADEEFFEETRAPVDDESRFVVDLDGYEGPIDVLLTLARDQKVDLTQISILQLADQYLAFVARVRLENLELAADYLVMAAWLAYLKSRLLLPELGGEDEPSGEELAAALAFQLRRLEAVQEAGTRLVAGSRLGRDVFARGAPEAFSVLTRPVVEVSLYELLKAYADQRRRVEAQTLHIDPSLLYSVDDALKRLRLLLGGPGEWQSIWSFLPERVGEGLLARSAMASTLAAGLELAREGRLKLRQGGTFGPIHLRATGTDTGNGKDTQ